MWERLFKYHPQVIVKMNRSRRSRIDQRNSSQDLRVERFKKETMPTALNATQMINGIEK